LDDVPRGGKEVETINQVFEFKECTSILKATGRKARNLRELRDAIAAVSEDCIFHHTIQYFLKQHILEYTNDFAHWAGESLEERSLAEHLSNVDPYGFGSIDDLRKEIVRVIDDYLANFPEPRDSMAGDEFYFNETVTLTFLSGVRAKNLAEFLFGIKYIDSASIYHHFYEARMRLKSGADDYSVWVERALGKKELAAEIRTIDPFMHTLEDIRQHIAEAVEREVEREMEIMP
jgi:hypothetical protein